MKQVLLFVCMVLTVSITASSQCSEADRKKLEEFDRAWGDAGRNGERALLEKIYADEFVNIGAEGMFGKKELIDWQMAQFEKNKKNTGNMPKTVPDRYMISCAGNTATITHRNTTSRIVEGKEEVEYSRSVHFLERRGDRWVVVSSLNNRLDDEAMLLYFEHDWNDADLHRDVAWFERNLDADYTSVSSRTGELSDKAKDIEDVKNSKQKVESLELSDLSVRIEGNTAVVNGVNRVKGKDASGASYDRNVRFTDTFIKRNGRWMAWATQGTLVQPK